MDSTPVKQDASQKTTTSVTDPKALHQASDPFSLTAQSSGIEVNDSGSLTTEQMTLAKRAKVVKTLPNEILDQILLQLDTAAPSNSKLYDEPIFDLTASEITDLKSSSMVCRRWRQAVLPFLFKHMCLLIRDPWLARPVKKDNYFPLIDFVRRNKLEMRVSSFVVCIQNSHPPSERDQFELENTNFAPFWNAIFETMNPLDVKITAPPMILGGLVDCHVDLSSYAYFEARYHYLQLRVLGTLPASDPSILLRNQEEHETQRAGADPGVPECGHGSRTSALLESRPWTSLLLNEGSFIAGYTMEDFHNRDAPSILPGLLGEVSDWAIYRSPKIPTSVRDFSYIAIFPPSTHFHKFTSRCPRLDRLYTQFVARNDALRDPTVAMHGLDQNDMWLERNSCYAYLMRELFGNPLRDNYRYLREFESGDAADVDAWKMAVEYMKRAGGGWRVEKPGVFIKDERPKRKRSATDPQEKEEEEEEEEEEGQVPSLLSVLPPTLP